MFRHLCAGLSMVALVAFTAPAFADIQDFIVRNNSKFAVFYIFVSPSYSEDWEEDVLGENVLMPNETFEILMSGYGDHCIFDIMVMDENDFSNEYYDVDLCTVRYVDFP